MKSTIITEYDFVCKKSYHFELLYTIEQSGYIVGTIVFSLIANKIGKKIALIYILFCMSVLGILQYWIKLYYLYTAVGFFINSLAAGVDTVAFPLMFETIKTSQRTRYGMAVSYIWVILFTGLSPLAYLIKTWRELRLAVFIFITILAFSSCFIVEESIMWLISKGEFDKASHVIIKIAKINQLYNTEKFKEEFSIIKQNFNQLWKFNETKRLKLKIQKVKINIFKEIIKEKIFFIYFLLVVFSWFENLFHIDNNLIKM
jgi:MFS family permease